VNGRDGMVNFADETCTIEALEGMVINNVRGGPPVAEYNWKLPALDWKLSSKMT